MSKVLELRQKAGVALDAWKAAVEARDAETDKEKRSGKTSLIAPLKKDYEDLMSELREAEELEAAETRAAGDNIQRQGAKNKLTPEDQLSESFSLLRAVKFTKEGRSLTGAEAEAFQEATKESRQAGSVVSMDGQIRIPAALVAKRTQTVGTATAGGNTVATDMGGLIAFLQPKLALEGMGAKTMTGLRANMEFPQETNMYDADWKGENVAADEKDSTFALLPFTPKRLTAYTRISNSWINQSDFPAESFARDRINSAVKRKLDATGINGSGTGDVPRGILNYGGIGSVAIGVNGGAPTWAHLVALWKEIAVDNADDETLNYLTTPGIAAQLMNTQKFTGTSGDPIWKSNNRMGDINGYNAKASNQVPANLTKGTAVGIANAILFGDFSKLLIGQWGGVDIIVNPYSQDTEAITKITIHSYWDMLVTQVSAFAAIKDALVTI